jgi:thiamine-phosphate pyrophosphorylase
MTDERMGEGLWPALQRLPKGAGVIFRHYVTPPAERRALYDRVRSVAKRRRLMLLLAGSPRVAVGWRADGAHGRSPHRRTSRRLIRTAPAHSARELHAARHADLALVSPVFPTRSHPGSKALGPAGVGGAHAPGRRAGHCVGRDDGSACEVARHAWHNWLGCDRCVESRIDQLR